MAMAHVAGQKRKRTVLTLETKSLIVRALEEGNSQRVVGEKFGVAKSTIADIWKYRKKISGSVSASDDEIVAECEDHNEDRSDEEAAAIPPVTASAAADALDITLRWLEQRSIDGTHLLLVRKWHDEAKKQA